MARTIYEVISDIQAKKEKFRIVPALATLTEIKRELEGIDEGTLHSMLDAEMMNGTIVRRRIINGYGFQVAEE